MEIRLGKRTAEFNWRKSSESNASNFQCKHGLECGTESVAECTLQIETFFFFFKDHIIKC
ncbi:hypothetical protein WH47_06216 [Habropoda laboriosa]|uniref:Uncharacterized protein n=1 Tax=Habropoda laboriosa TaxID=597456 RepID=A0A0L7RJW3_9HYME|nr:hypothetical protein WH47_06216 [Habropoda laboriosa]